MKKNKDVFEFYESPYVATLGMLISIAFIIIGFIQPGPVKEPIYIPIMMLPFPLIFFFFFLKTLKKPFILLDSKKITVKKETFLFSDIDTIFFYRAVGGGANNRPNYPQEILDIRLKKGETLQPVFSVFLVPKHYFTLSFMSYNEIRLLEKQLRLLKKVKVMHLPPQDRATDLPYLRIPKDMIE